MKARTKTHKKHGTVRTDLAKRKKPTVAKHAGPFRSKRVKPTSKERIMAKAAKDYGDEAEPAAELPPDKPPVARPDIVTLADQLVADLELAAAHNSPVPPATIELAQQISDTAKALSHG